MPLMIRAGVLESMNFVSVRSWMQAIGERPRLVRAVPVDSPQDQERTSISPLCFSSCDSPVTPSTLRNMSLAAMAVLEASRVAVTTLVAKNPFRLCRFIVSSFR